MNSLLVCSTPLLVDPLYWLVIDRFVHCTLTTAYSLSQQVLLTSLHLIDRLTRLIINLLVMGERALDLVLVELVLLDEELKGMLCAVRVLAKTVLEACELLSLLLFRQVFLHDIVKHLALVGTEDTVGHRHLPHGELHVVKEEELEVVLLGFLHVSLQLLLFLDFLSGELLLYGRGTILCKIVYHFSNVKLRF